MIELSDFAKNKKVDYSSRTVYLKNKKNKQNLII